MYMMSPDFIVSNIKCNDGALSLFHPMQAQLFSKNAPVLSVYSYQLEYDENTTYNVEITATSEHPDKITVYKY